MISFDNEKQATTYLRGILQLNFKNNGLIKIIPGKKDTEIRLYSNNELKDELVLSIQIKNATVLGDITAVIVSNKKRSDIISQIKPELEKIFRRYHVKVKWL